MQVRSQGHRDARLTIGWRWAGKLFGSGMALLSLTLSFSLRLGAQDSFGVQPPEGIRTDRIDLASPINQVPDAVSQLRSKHRHANQLNFDAANELRQRQIVDEVTKLLILARDLRAQIKRLGADPLPERLIREAETIEVFARDVQQRMILTVGPS